jgi:hypothetical protein
MKPATAGFAFVMASGIVSVAASLQGLPVTLDALLAVACVTWVSLAATQGASWPRTGLMRCSSSRSLPGGLGLLYPIVIVAIARGRRDFAPDLWIGMGVLAIATLAGSELVLAARASDVLQSLRPALGDVDSRPGCSHRFSCRRSPPASS